MTKQKVFIARDKNGELYFFSEEPKLREDGTFIAPGFVSDRTAFKDVEKGTFKQGVIEY